MTLPMPSKNQLTLLTVLLACGVLPFLINGCFAHPWTDDYAYSVLAREQGFIAAWQQNYTYFNGRYFSVSLVLANPLSHGQLWGYKLIPGLLLAGLLAALLLLVSAVVRDCLTIRAKLVFSLCILLVYLDQMPDIRPGLYWMSGSLTYQAGAILLLIFIALLLRLHTAGDGRRNRLTGLFLLILAGCLPGTNEIILFILLPALTFCLCYDFSHERRILRLLLTALVTAGTGAGFVLLAPGSSARLAGYTGNRDTLLAIQQSTEAACAAMAVWASTPLVLLLTLLVVVTVRNHPELKKIVGGIHPVITASALILLVIAGFFPPYWGTGHYPERRVVNIIYLFFLLGWLVNAAAVATRIPVSKQPLCGRSCKVVIYPVITGYLVVLLWMGHSNFMLVTGDLLSGRSYRYDLELRERYAKIRQSPLPHHQVDPLGNTPMSLFFADINFTGEGWINQSYADYYGKESIIVKKSPSSP